MPHPTFWTCRACDHQLGQTRPDGSLEVLSGRVILPAATAAEGVVIVICAGCGDRRRWPLPGFEVKAGSR